jgi:hypothetical protein
MKRGLGLLLPLAPVASQDSHHPNARAPESNGPSLNASVGAASEFVPGEATVGFRTGAEQAARGAALQAATAAMRGPATARG